MSLSLLAFRKAVAVSSKFHEQKLKKQRSDSEPTGKKMWLERKGGEGKSDIVVVEKQGFSVCFWLRIAYYLSDVLTRCLYNG